MSIADNLEQIHEKIERACEKSGRSPQEVQLLAVSKTWPAEKIREAYEAGQRLFGENYVQEANPKFEALKDLDIEWHFIGHLQSKKVNAILNQYFCVQTVDRDKLISALDQRLDNQQRILLEVNFAGESSKSGAAPEEVPALIERIQESKNLCLCGIMCMPPYDLDDKTRANLFDKIRRDREGWGSHLSAPHHLKELSLGTSHDFELAIQFQSTMVRLGTAVFGERHKS